MVLLRSLTDLSEALLSWDQRQAGRQRVNDLPLAGKIMQTEEEKLDEMRRGVFITLWGT